MSFEALSLLMALAGILLPLLLAGVLLGRPARSPRAEPDGSGDDPKRSEAGPVVRSRGEKL